MTAVVLGACVTLLAYLAGIVAGSPIALALARRARGAADPDARARRLFAVRMLPAGLGGFLALGVVLPSFVRLEPAHSAERVGVALAAVAALAGLVIALGVGRGALGILGTRRLVRGWDRSARPIRLRGFAAPAYRVEDRFPVVAVTACFRPRLYVSESVLRHCTGEEIEAILSHETRHLRHGDPWKRLLLRASPDLLALTPWGAEIERCWVEASEHAADDYVAASGRGRSLDLASALIRIARLAGPGRPPALPLTTLYRGGGVADRAARLLHASPVRPAAPARRGSRAGLALAASGVLLAPPAAALGAFGTVHRVLEAAVRLLS